VPSVTQPPLPLSPRSAELPLGPILPATYKLDPAGRQNACPPNGTTKPAQCLS